MKAKPLCALMSWANHQNTNVRHLLYLVLAFVLAAPFSVHAQSQAKKAGAAIAIVYDTSGSMGQPVDNKVSREPKYKVASKALRGIVEAIDRYAQTNDVEASLVRFGSGQANSGLVSEAIPFGPWNRKAFDGWLDEFKSPGAGTPLGESLVLATDSLRKSKQPRKYIVAITDGESNGKINPAAAVKDALAAGAGAPSIYVVAFDVDAKAFLDVRKAGAVILPAADEKALAGELHTLFATKILLEAEE